jgi:transketolase
VTVDNSGLEILSNRIRRRILDTAFAANKGHLGSALSICEIVAAVVTEARYFGSNRADRDRVVLSKGHASLALYCALAELELLDEAELKEYTKNNSLLQTHPDVALPGVDFSTGSLGMGLGYGVGVALASRVQHRGVRTFVVLSDSELNEGSTWESAALAGTLQLGHLTVVLDFNGQQALGYTHDVLRVGDPAVVWSELGFDVEVVDGHDVQALASSLSRDAAPNAQPRLVVARTNSGHGVSFMERRIEWHYRPMTAEQYETAIREADAS